MQRPQGGIVIGSSGNRMVARPQQPVDRLVQADRCRGWQGDLISRHSEQAGERTAGLSKQCIGSHRLVVATAAGYRTVLPRGLLPGPPD
jgi:hypothetical protein